ncbi:MAG: DUF2868 domain-containing protein [Chitinophagaceae bacterium]|nr:DUF2868 domain-containing protein [Oligoflexus sp.]
MTQRSKKTRVSPFTMTDLLDFEAQMARDTLADPEVLSTRDRPIAPSPDKARKIETLHTWLLSIRAIAADPWPGSKIQRTYDLMSFIALAFGIISGMGLIEGLLRYDGSEPVNVIPFLAVYALLQIILLLNYVFKTFVYRLFKRLPGGALLYFLREGALRWIESRGSLLSNRDKERPMIKAFARRLSQLHRPLLEKYAWKLVQIFGIACHGASLLTFLCLIFFNDYTFGWRTTLHVEADFLHTVVTILAAPFHWLGGDTAPSFEVIRASQFTRFGKSFMASGSDLGARSTAAWWPFLALVILTYGLIPRFLIWVSLTFSIKHTLSTLLFNDFRSEALWQRLTREQVEWIPGGVLESAPTIQDQTLFNPSLQKTLGDCLVLRWRDFPASDSAIESYLVKNFGLKPIASLKSSGLVREQDALKNMLERHRQLPLVVAADPWELPGEAIEKIRRLVREQGSPTSLILFAPIDSKADALTLAGDRTAWRHALKAFRDPHLGLLEEAR